MSAPAVTASKRRIAVPEVAVAPLLVTRHNCGAALGWTRQQFLGFLRQHREIPQIRLGTTKRGKGRLVAVLADELREVLRSLAATTPSDAEVAPVESTSVGDNVGDDQPLTADAVLRELGRRRVRGAR